MVRFNDYRLMDILNNYKDNLELLDHSYKRFKSCEGLDKRMALSSVKDCVRATFTITEEYLGRVLKSKNISVSGKTFKQCLLDAKEYSIIDSEFSNCMRVNIKFRNYHSHNYSLPKDDEYIDFYIDVRPKYVRFIKFIEQELENKNKYSKREIKKSNIFS